MDEQLVDHKFLTRLEKISVLPSPKRMELLSGTCRYQQLKTAVIGGVTPEMMQVFARELKDINIYPTICLEGMAFLQLGMKPGSRFAVPSVTVKHKEGYLLRVLPRSIEIFAHSEIGLWWGLQTLEQIMEDHPDNIPCLKITDWPLLSFRGIHIDLKGYQPKIARLREIFRTLARYKVNAVLLELEDKFQFECAPEIAKGGAYSKKELRRLADEASKWKIQIIPKIQCLAHVDYILKHSRYRNLREGKRIFQYCPNNPASYCLWQRMAEEVIDVFSASRWFHIGADEAFYLGTCPRCRKQSRMKTYLTHINKSIDWIIERGMEPIIWDDILRKSSLRYYQSLKEKVTLMYWVYGYEGKDNKFPFTMKYLKAGFRVLGASSYSGCGPTWINNIPYFEYRERNIAAWTEEALQQGLTGVMCTGWGRVASADPPTEPHDACWHSIVFAAQSTWSGNKLSSEEFDQLFLRSFFGVDSPELAGALHDPHSDPIQAAATLRRFRRSVTRNKGPYEIFCAANAIDCHRKKREWAFMFPELYWSKIGKGLEDYRRELAMQLLADLEKHREKGADLVRQIYGRFFSTDEVDEVIVSRFGQETVLANEFASRIAKTRNL